MKNRFLATTLLLGSLIVGCSKAEVEDVTKVTTDGSSAKVVEVMASHGSSTRVGVTLDPDAAVGEEYISYNWEFDDAIGVLYRRGAANIPTSFYVKRNTISDDKMSAVLTGTIDYSLITSDGYTELDDADDGEFRVGAILHSTYATSRNPASCSFDVSVQSTAGEVEAEDVVMLASGIYNDNDATIETFEFKNYSSILDLTIKLHSSLDDKDTYESSGLDEAVLTITGSNLTNSATFDLITNEEVTPGAKSAGGIRATLTSILGKGTESNPLRAPITIFPTSDDEVLGDLSFEFRTTVNGITAVYTAEYTENSLGNFIDAGKYYTMDLDLERVELADGDTEDQPIKIYDAEDLIAVATDINNGTKTGENVYYRVMTDIDLNNEEWTPIGNDSAKPFMGNFDGNNCTISGLKITEDIKYAGLIGVMKLGYLKNLTVKGEININSEDRSVSQYAGGLIAYMPINATGAVSLSGNLTSEVNVTYKYDVAIPYVMPEGTTTDKSVNIGGAFGYLSISAESVAEGTVITSGAEDKGTSVDVVSNSSLIYVGGVAGQLRSSTSGTITAATYTDNIVRMISNTSVTTQGYPTPEMQANCFIYVGGIIGYVTNANINGWRGTVTTACKKVHGFASPKNDTASKSYARWVCVGGFAGDINAVNMFYYSDESDTAPSSTKIIAGLTADAADESTATALFGAENSYPTYKILVGTFAGTKGTLTGGGNAQTANKQPDGSGAIANTTAYPVVVRSSNYFQLYNETDAKGFLSTFFHMSHSGYIITTSNWDSFDTTYPTVKYVNLYTE